MESCRVTKGALKGEITIPSSKSHTLRAILFASLARGKSLIRFPLPSPDTKAMIQACRHFGAAIRETAEGLEVEGVDGRIASTEDVIDAGNSGIVLRFCAAVGALSPLPVVITGDHSIRHQRPMRNLLQALDQLGVRTATTRGDGFAPVILQGPLKGGTAQLEGADSQPVSALLIASAFAAGATELLVRNPGEKPWVALTLDWFDRLGIPYTNQNFETYRLPGGCRYEGFEYAVPGDLSSAAFPLAAAAVTGSELLLRNVDMEDVQGDKEFIHLLTRMGASIEADAAARSLHIAKGGPLKGIEADINGCIDAITILAVLGCFAEGQTRIVNAAVARSKECDRIGCIVRELKSMGADIRETPDGLVVKKSALNGAQVSAHGDHRMAMSLAVAALGAEGSTRIDGVQCVSKTYPTFFEDFRRLGAAFESMHH